MNKKYQQKRNIKDVKPGLLCPVLPGFAEGDPAIDTTVYRWFDPEGKYLGWCSDNDGRKFLYGKLYYKTKGVYQTKTKRSLMTRDARLIHVNEKVTGKLALYGVRRTIVQADLVDFDDKIALITASRTAIQDFEMSRYNYTQFPNNYQVIPIAMRRKFEKDMDEFLLSKKKELIDYLNTYESSLTEQRRDEVSLGILIDI